jgi:hypothetical protein
MPLWRQVKKKIFERLYPGGTEEDFNKLSMDSNRLAQEFELEFGVGELNELLSSLVPDHNYEPSAVFESLFKLRWADILTTNYDTLLERGASKFSTPTYATVFRQEDLAFKESPRIIKLHGSMPNSYPLIITEDHFRKYSSNYPAFVNTVQQIMIENSLVMVGFSGDDPNFLAWSGWVRDNLGEDRKNIYLVGVLKLTKTQRRILESRRIYPIDYAEYVQNSAGENHHEKAISHFFNYLANHKPIRAEKWPQSNDLFLTTENGETVGVWSHLETFLNSRFLRLDNKKISSDDLVSTFKTVLLALRELRALYPNWAICPYDASERFAKDLAPIFQDFEKYWQKIPIITSFEIAYHISFFIVETHQSIVSFGLSDFYNIATELIRIIDPFPGETDAIRSRQENIEAIYSPKNQPKWNWDEIADYWMFIALAIPMRIDLFNIIMKTLKPIAIRNESWNDHWRFQSIIDSKSQLKWEAAVEMLNEWQEKPSSLAWQAKKALLLFDFGFKDQSASVFEGIITSARQLLHSGKSEISVLSIQGLALRGKLFSSAAGMISRPKNEKFEFEDTFIKLQEFFADSWKNVWDILDKIDPYPIKPPLAGPKNRNFNFDSSSIPSRLKTPKTNWNPVLAYINLFLMEGFPFRSFSTSISKSISSLSHSLAVHVFEKIENIGEIERLLDSGRVWALSEDDTTKAIDRNLAFIESSLSVNSKIVNYPSNAKKRFNSQFQRSFLIVSRLFSKMGETYFLRVFNVLKLVLADRSISKMGEIKDSIDTMVLQLSILGIGSNYGRPFFKWVLLEDAESFFNLFEPFYFSDPFSRILQFSGTQSFKAFLDSSEIRRAIESYLRFFYSTPTNWEARMPNLSKIAFLHAHFGLEQSEISKISNSLEEMITGISVHEFQAYYPIIERIVPVFLSEFHLTKIQDKIKVDLLKKWRLPFPEKTHYTLDSTLIYGFEYLYFSKDLEWSKEELDIILRRIEEWLSISTDQPTGVQNVVSNIDRHSLIYLQLKIGLIAKRAISNEKLEIFTLVTLLDKIGVETMPIKLITAILNNNLNDVGLAVNEMEEAFGSKEYFRVFSAIKSILFWAQCDHSNREESFILQKAISELLRYVRYRNLPALGDAIKALGYLIWNHASLFTQHHRSIVVSILGLLHQEFCRKLDYGIDYEKMLIGLGLVEKGNDFDELRISSTQFALAAFRLFDDEIPDILNKWKTEGLVDSSAFVRYAWESNQFFYKESFSL